MTTYDSVDGHYSITVSEQSNFKTFLNGWETGMFSKNVSQALKSFPGSSMTKIEVITNPSAKYDAEGVGGIINIVQEQNFRWHYHPAIVSEFWKCRNQL